MPPTNDWTQSYFREQGRPNPSEKFDPTNLFVKHLPSTFDDGALRNLFTPFGEIVSAKVYVDSTTLQSKGFGFVTFAQGECAKVAMEEVHGKEIPPNKILVVEPAIKHVSTKQAASNNLYVKNLPASFTTDDLRELFESFGDVQKCRVLQDNALGVSKRVGLVMFQSLPEAQAALKALDKQRPSPEDLPLDVRFARGEAEKMSHQAKPSVKSSFREGETGTKNHRRSSFDDKVDGGINLFVFHLPEDWTESHLTEHFGKFGAISSAKVMVHLTGEKQGQSRGFGFVKFRDAANGITAIEKVNGTKVKNKKLLVTTKRGGQNSGQ